MSELKAVHAFDVYEAYTKTGDDDAAQVYLKSEVDKIFRRLKARLARKGISIQQLEIDKNNNWRKYCQAIIELRHQKYKRCLAMAGKCENGKLIYQYKQRCGDAETEIGLDYLMKRAGWYRKWQLRWLELAEEPTWAKFLQLIHKEVK